MSTISLEVENQTLQVLEQLVDIVSDPIRAYLFIEIIRNADITPNDLKKRLMIKGSKIYFHLKKMEEYDIIEGSGTEEIKYHNQQLSRRKYRISSSLINILNQLGFEDFSDIKQSKLFRIMNLFQLYLGIALLQQKVRESNGKNFIPSDASLAIMAFVDKEIAETIKQGVLDPLSACFAKYRNMKLTEVMQACTYGVVAGIFPMV